MYNLIRRVVLCFYFFIAILGIGQAQNPLISNNGNEILVKPTGDVSYKTSGDPNVVEQGKYSTSELNSAFRSLKKVKDGAKVGGSFLSLDLEFTASIWANQLLISTSTIPGFQAKALGQPPFI